MFWAYHCLGDTGEVEGEGEMILRGPGGEEGGSLGRPERGVGPGGLLGPGITVSCKQKWLKEGALWTWWVVLGRGFPGGVPRCLEW